MKTVQAVLVGIFVLLGVFAVGATRPAHAQSTLYDNFNAMELDPDKWSGRQDDRNVLPGAATLELTRRIVSRELEMSYRVVGGISADTGRTDSRNRLIFQEETDAIIAVKFDIEVRDFDVLGCAVGGPRSRFRAGFNGRLFDSTSGDFGAQGHVGAVVELIRDSASSDPPPFVRARGLVFRCENPGCFATTFRIVDLGQVKMGERVTLRMSWDEMANTIDFQKDDETVESIDYSDAPFFTTDDSTRVGARRLEVDGQVPNCTVEPRPFAEVSATFNNVFVDRD